METEPFPICTEPVPKLVGREDLLEQLVRNLTKPSPGHQSIVGPRYMGKTVLFAALADSIRGLGSYTAVIQWDLRHDTPQSDDAFRKALCTKIGEGLLQTPHADSGKELLALTDDYQEVLGMVLDEIAESDEKILMLWDGFDRPLTQGNLSLNLWDNLRELALKPSLCLVTASRKELSSLIRDEASVTSDFWNIFQPTRLKPFVESDLQEMLAILDGYTFPKGAKTEFGNWTGHVPILCAMLLNTIKQNIPPGEVSPSSVVDAAKSCQTEVESYGLALWKDLDVTTQDAYRDLIHSGGVAIGCVKKNARIELTEFGLAVEERSTLLPACRMIQTLIEDVDGGSDAMFRLFGSPDSYANNLPELLARRLSHLDRFHEILFRLVEGSIDSMHRHAPMALAHLTNIRDAALNWIFDGELEATWEVPSDTIFYWTEVQEELPRKRRDGLIDEMMAADDWRVPSNPGQQIHLLKLLVGADERFSKNMTKYISKQAYVLLEHVHGYRNMNEHMQGEDLSAGVAGAALMTCVELLACLEPKDTE